MPFKRFNLDMERFLSTGSFLCVEEQLILQVSLPILQQENRFQSVSFRAKILGSKSDYYIACGRGKDYIRNKMFFYSLDGHTWQVLFPPSAADLTEFRYTRNRFTGDPTHVHRFHVGEQRIAIREENRLSAAMHLMDWETDIGPKGSLQVDVQGIVQKNPYFGGMSDLTDLSVYVHHRVPRSLESFAPSTCLCPAAGDSATEFLETIVSDYPPGCWVLRSDPVQDVVWLRNFWWPGFNFYCCANSAEFATLYIGLGDRNDDLPFMM